MTIADNFAALFHDDGQCWRTAAGRSWSEVADALDAHSEDGAAVGRPDAVRLTFPDGSVITAIGEGWDRGFPDCWCWAGSPRDGHTEGRCGAGEG